MRVYGKSIAWNVYKTILRYMMITGMGGWGATTREGQTEVNVDGRTGRWMKNMVTAPTIGTSPIRGSRITRIIPCSWGQRSRKDVCDKCLQNCRLSVYLSYPFKQAKLFEEYRPVFLWLQLCRSISSPQRWSLHFQHSWGYENKYVIYNNALLKALIQRWRWHRNPKSNGSILT